MTGPDPISRRFPAPMSLRKAVQDMKISAALEYVLDAYDDLSGAGDARLAELILEGLSPQQALIYSMLEARAGSAVSLDHILSVVGSASWQRGGASQSSIPVQISRIRTFLRRRGWPPRIEAVNGYGYRMITTDQDRPRLSGSADLPVT